MDEGQIREQVDLIREVFYYSNRFKDKVFVIKIDYSIMTQSFFPLLVKDLAMLNQAGIRIVIVPGAKERIDEILERYSLKTSFHKGTRISPPEAIPFIKMAAFDVVNRFMTLLAGYKVTALVGNWVKARAIGVRDGIDFQDTGQVDRINLGPLRRVLEEGHIPVFPCIGWNASGKPYNLPSEDLALALSESLQADKLFWLSETPGIFQQNYQIPPEIPVSLDGRIARMSLNQARNFLKLNDDQSQSRDAILVEKGLRACRQGVSRVHIIDGRTEGVILKEIFSNQGIGTMIYSNDYESIRPMARQDLSEILRLMEPLVKEGVLIQRSEAQLLEQRKDFVVYEVDGVIHACGALHLYGDKAEIAGLAIDESSRQMGIGQRILVYLIQLAKSQSLKSVFVLTTRTADWFLAQGFQEWSLDRLPEVRRKNYDKKRQARIYGLELNSWAGVPGIPGVGLDGTYVQSSVEQAAARAALEGRPASLED